MPRPNTGPRLKWIEKRQAWYVVWYEAGRERLRSTGTADGGEAEALSRNSSATAKPAADPPARVIRGNFR
jgi:hypothetical protein